MDDDSRNFSLLTDILEVPRDATVDIMDHPVITTFITRRWPKGLFYTMAAVYLVFVLCFTFYLLFTFSPHGSGVFGRIFGKDCSRNEWGLCQKVLENNNIQTSNLSKIAYCSRACLNQDAFQACSTNDPKMCASEIGLIISTVILLAQEIWQLIALRADYIREAENFFEWFIIVASLVCLFYREAEWLSTISSITVLLAWIQLIFIMGRLPSYVGEFSLMYYASSKKVLMIAVGFFLMIVAFGLAFFILHFGSLIGQFSRLSKEATYAEICAKLKEASEGSMKGETLVYNVFRP